MKKVNIFKAQRIDQRVMVTMDTVIFIDREMPKQEKFDDTRGIFDKEAKMLFEALRDALPGGTLSALFAEMCEHYRNMHVVR